jgi:ceramide glucosyltransferase
MLDPQPSKLAIVTLALSACGVILHTVAASRLRRHLRKTDADEAKRTPPLTLWRALKEGVPELDAKLHALVQASRAEDQILLGANVDSAELRSCERLQRHYPDRRIDVVPCQPARAENPKISKFLQMTSHARHEHWLLTDSEAIFDERFIEGFRREWAAGSADAQSAGYRFIGLNSVPQILDASSALLTLWPGLMLTRRMDFTLGACTAVKAFDVRVIGGWEAVANELADDQRLGALLVNAGRKIQLSRHILTLDSDPLGWRDYLCHQHRVAVTFRAAAPGGALGLPILHTVALAALVPVLHPAWWKWAALILALRIVAAAVVSRLLQFHLPGLPVTTLAGTLVETIVWAAAWFSPSVWWSGRWRNVQWRGMFKGPAEPGQSTK